MRILEQKPGGIQLVVTGTEALFLTDEDSIVTRAAKTFPTLPRPTWSEDINLDGENFLFLPNEILAVLSSLPTKAPIDWDLAEALGATQPRS